MMLAYALTLAVYGADIACSIEEPCQSGTCVELLPGSTDDWMLVSSPIGVCKDLTGAGAVNAVCDTKPATATKICNDGLICEVTGGAGQCVEAPGKGADCQEGLCEADLACMAGKCQPMCSLSVPCEDTKQTCVVALQGNGDDWMLIEDPILGACLDMGTGSAAGGVCDADFSVAVQFCKEGVCQVNSGTGSCVAAPGKGDACMEGLCGPEQLCTAGKCQDICSEDLPCADSKQVCAAALPGDVDDWMVVETLFGGSCLDLSEGVAIGQECDADLNNIVKFCEEGICQVTSGKGKCVAAPGAGEACLEGLCGDGFECTANKCQKAESSTSSPTEETDGALLKATSFAVAVMSALLF